MSLQNRGEVHGGANFSSNGGGGGSSFSSGSVGSGSVGGHLEAAASSMSSLSANDHNQFVDDLVSKLLETEDDDELGLQVERID